MRREVVRLIMWTTMFAAGLSVLPGATSGRLWFVPLILLACTLLVVQTVLDRYDRHRARSLIRQENGG